MSWQGDITDAFRTRAQSRTMRRIAAIYRECPELRTAAWRMSECCTHGMALVARLPSDAKIAPYRCDDRLCPACNEHRTRHARATLRQRLEHESECELAEESHPARARRHYVRFLTLTMRHNPEWSPEDAYRAASTAFLRLTRTKSWTKHVRGAFASYESTWGSSGWHPHWHVLAVGRYWESSCGEYGSCVEHSADRMQYISHGIGGAPISRRSALAAAARDRCLSCTWVQSGGGPVVDVRKADPRAVEEVTKYPLKVAKIPDEQVVAWRLGMVRRRTTRTYGEWYGIQRRAPDDGLERLRFRFAELEDAAAGDPVTCRRIVERLASAWDETMPDDIPLWSERVIAELRYQLSERRRKTSERGTRRRGAPRVHTPPARGIP